MQMGDAGVFGQLGAEQERAYRRAGSREDLAGDRSEPFRFQHRAEVAGIEPEPAMAEPLANPLLAVREKLEHEQAPALLQELARISEDAARIVEEVEALGSDHQIEAAAGREVV